MKQSSCNVLQLIITEIAIGRKGMAKSGDEGGGVVEEERVVRGEGW